MPSLASLVERDEFARSARAVCLARAANHWRVVPPAAGDQAPDDEYDDRANDRANEPGTFASPIPADGLAEISGYDRTDDAEDSGHDEAARLVLVTRHEEFGDDAGDQANDDGPDDFHGD